MLIITQKGDVLNLSHIGRMWIEMTNNGTFQIKADFFRWLNGLVMAEFNERERSADQLYSMTLSFSTGRKLFKFER